MLTFTHQSGALMQSGVIKSTTIGHRLHPWRYKKPLPRVKSTALRQQQMPKTCDYGASHAGDGCSSHIRFTARKDARLLFVAPHDCWWQSCRDTRNFASSFIHFCLLQQTQGFFFRLSFFWTSNPTLPRRLTLRPLGAVSWMSSAV